MSDPQMPNGDGRGVARCRDGQSVLKTSLLRQTIVRGLLARRVFAASLTS